MWLIAFEAHCRTKKLRDALGKDGTSPQTDQFLERCGSKALLKIISMLPGKNITQLTFATIKEAVEDYIQPRKRLIIADRTYFLQMKQNAGESEVDFLTRLNEASTHCNWDSLKTETPSEELVKLRFIAGLQDDMLKLKILEKLQLIPSATTTEIDFCQMHSQLSNFVMPTTSSEDTPVENFFVEKSRSRCRNCGSNHPPRQCPAYSKTCKSAVAKPFCKVLQTESN